MELIYAMFTTLLGFGFLFGSFYMEDRWGSFLLAFNSMLLFFFTAAGMLYITEAYQFITSTDTIITGVHWLTEYQPYSIYYMGMGFFSLIWCFILIFWDFLMPVLKKLGVT